jgi:hypothetical protein
MTDSSSCERNSCVSHFIKVFITAFLLMSFVSNTTCASTLSQPDDLVGIRLGGSDLCTLEILGVLTPSARIYGHKPDVVKLLDGAQFGKSGVKCVGPCPCLLATHTGECMFNRAQKVATTGSGAPPPPPSGTILLIIDEPNTPNNGNSLLTRYKNSKTDSGCTVELCANSKGEASLSFKCGDINLKVSSSGKMSMSITSGNLTVTLP